MSPTSTPEAHPAMRIAYLHSGSIPSVYANGVHVMRMCDAFTDAGHEVVLYALPGTVPAGDAHRYYGTRNRFEVRSIAQPALLGLGVWIRAWRIRADLRRRGTPDLLYGRDLRALLVSSGLTPLVYETHLMWSERIVRRIEGVLFRRRNLRRVVFVSQALADDYRRAFPELDSSRWADLVTAHDCADPAPADGPVADLPGRPEAPKIGYVGHLYPGRGIDVILELAARVPEADFHLVGGTTADREHWQSCCTRSNVYFHGHLPPAELAPYQRAFDMVLAPYQRRTFCAGGVGEISRWVSPMKLFEYMSHGKAIIASDLPVLREILTDGANCLLCPPDSTEAWAAAVKRLVGDPHLRDTLGGEARRQLHERHTWRIRADRVLPEPGDTTGTR
ncbi:glycosyltransferase family 4 protein [Streptomyces rhizosphaerihabitans]|uniref:glycosyltransferase family 4 protein n=1 Tax=Streptomyces rhizosphaerihabitans TaxID=1266770 RepID=UPI0021C031C5|nr:glycosyltransferase family 4 protein [Streptomyces rhizosphaerihabitans]MCT9011633.1 glycosyltransferase family 4 protein [Streptomyces rhizosphaerihabitans]